MAEVNIDGVRIAYRRGGSGAPLVLFHGAFEDSRAWIETIQHLSPHLDVIAWDAPGCGASDDVPRHWNARNWADAAAGFVAALRLSAPAVAGFSLGSVMALLLAREHPESVGRLVLVGAYAGWGGSLDSDALAQRVAAVRFTVDHPPEEWADDFLDSVFAPDARPERRALARTLLEDWRPATTLALLNVMVQDLRPDLANIRTPTVIVRGTADARSPRHAAVEMCALLPRARLVEIVGAGHDSTGQELESLLVAVSQDAHADAAPPVD